MGSIGYFPHPCFVPKKKKKEKKGQEREGRRKGKIKTISLFPLYPNFASVGHECE